ncbi:MAG: hypothetical protein EZS28_010056 [Streblomastix strix]|uniref:Uncharacterized protein n=1 Tax=Streblomastix strix TaxID=222440 RepID=A0A5J4WH67_9EUKA|nr:MAG: hypothetical protein EZS28_010056 [Streblomastix strix]
MKLSNEEKEKSLNRAKDAEDSYEKAQVKITELEASINSAKEQGRREVAPLFIQTQEKLRICEGEKNKLQEEIVLKGEQFKQDTQKISEDLSQTKIELEILKMKCSSIENQYETEKQQWIEKQQQQQKQQKESNIDTERGNRFEVLYKQEEEQRHKLEHELQVELEEKEQLIEMKKDIEVKYVQNEEERRKTEQTLRFEREERISAVNQIEDIEKSEQEEHNKRIKAENDANKIKWENEKLKKENEKLKFDLQEEKNQRKDYQTRYNMEFEEKMRELELRRQIEQQQRIQQIDKQESEQFKEDQETRISELDNKLLSTIEELRVQNVEYERIRIKVEKEIEKAKEEEKRRKDIEIEKIKLELENWNLKRDNEKMKITSDRLKEEFGEGKINEQFELACSVMQEQDEQVLRLREELERETAEKIRNEEEIAHLREQIRLKPVSIEPILHVADSKFCYIQGDTFMRTNKSIDRNYTITVYPAITEGIVYFECVFFNHDEKIFYIGIQNVEQGANNENQIILFSEHLLISNTLLLKQLVLNIGLNSHRRISLILKLGVGIRGIIERFCGKEDFKGKKQKIEAGITEGLLNIFETRDLNTINKIYITTMQIFTQTNNEIIMMLFQKKDPFPGLLRLIDHSDFQISYESIGIIYNIIIHRANGSDQDQQHPFLQAVEACDGIRRIFGCYKRYNNKFIKDRSALCIGLLFRSREIADIEIKSEVIAHLKSLVKDFDYQISNSAKQSLKGLSKNEVNRTMIELRGFKIPD